MQHLAPGNNYPRTPDGRYFVVRGRLWRCSDTILPPYQRTVLVKRLMAAQSAVGHAKAGDNSAALLVARDAIDKAKHELGERGPVWWNDAHLIMPGTS